MIKTGAGQGPRQDEGLTVVFVGTARGMGILPMIFTSIGKMPMPLGGPWLNHFRL
jgi:hypothetical protein